MQILKTDDPEVARMLAHYHRLRNDRWHATYNAALQSSLVNAQASNCAGLMRIARDVADETHGPLEPTDG